MNILAIILFLFSLAAPVSAPYTAEGKATYYADRLHGQPTASGERYDKQKLTAAHASLPFGTVVKVTNTRNGLSATVRINDRMARKGSTIIDVSRAAAQELGLVRQGIAPVLLEEMEP